MAKDQAPVRLEKCDTCIFWPGNRAHLVNPATRVKEMTEGAARHGSYIPCHHHLQERRRGVIKIVCRGYYDARPEATVFQLAERLGVLVFTDDDGLVVACQGRRGLFS